MIQYNKHSSPPIENIWQISGVDHRQICSISSFWYILEPQTNKYALLSITTICKILDTKYTFHKTCKNKTKKSSNAKDIIFQVSVTHYKYLNRKCSLHILNLERKSVSAESACEVNEIFSELRKWGCKYSYIWERTVMLMIIICFRREYLLEFLFPEFKNMFNVTVIFSTNSLYL